MKNIEVEIRSFVTDEEYVRLKKYFDLEGEFVKEDEQTTLYFDCKEDLRLQKNNSGGKIWYKSGKIHDDQREEIEIKIDADDFDNSRKIFENLGYKVEIIWLRHRLQYQLDDIKITLDDTKGYGKILELEMISSEENNDDILNKLKNKMTELNIEITPKEEFNIRFEEYKEGRKWLNV